MAEKVYEVAEHLWEKAVLSKAVKIASTDNPEGETSFIEIHKCYHDEMPARSCELIKPRKET